MKKAILLTFLLFITYFTNAQDDAPLKGFAIKAPEKENLDRFVAFINEELAPRGINTLILRVDYDYEYKNHPELRNEKALTQVDVDKIVNVCQKNKIKIVPQINLLGHQSWAGKLEKLLQVYPQFDETPKVKMPEKYVWPNPEGLYCKSYCPNHPEVHKVVFELVDELLTAFRADNFHAGMDEVFYIGDTDCPRCGGGDKAEIFAVEVTRIRNFLAQKNRKLWIWGDRLLDGKSTGLGMWEASMNNTHRAIDLIPKDIMICDWHYERPDPTAAIFALKGFDIATCPWKNGENALLQQGMMDGFRKHATKETKPHYKGMIQTVWSGVANFLDNFYKPKVGVKEDEALCFKTLFPRL